MRRRAEQDQDFEQVKQNLFEAGVSVVKAAQAHEEMFHTSLEALAEAYEGQSLPMLEATEVEITDEVAPIREKLLSQRQAAISAQNVDVYLEASEKLKRLKELEVEEIELDARRLEAQIRIMNAQQQLSPSLTPHPEPKMTEDGQWTEKTIKARYKKLSNLEKETGIKADRWNDAVKQANESKLGR
jgi:hypothetical protein